MNKEKSLHYVHLREREFLEANPHWRTQGTVAVDNTEFQRILHNLRTNYTSKEIKTHKVIGAKEYIISFTTRPDVTGEVIEYKIPDAMEQGATGISLDIFADSTVNVLEIFRALNRQTS